MLKCWFLLVLLMLAACQEKEELNHVAKGSVSLKASIENSDARTSVDEEGHVSWVVADAIGVFGEETENARFQSISSGSEVLFIGDMSSHQDVPFLAYYPYDENASLDGNALHFTLPSSYTYTGQSQAPMLGVKQADGNFVFKHLCGLLKVKVKNMPQNAKRLFVVSEGTEDKEAPAITGDVLVNDVTADNATLNITQNKGHEVSIDLKNTSAQETYTFFIPIPVGEYPMLSVKLEMNDGVINMDKSTSNVNMRRAMMLDMPLIDLLEKKPDLGENMVLGDNTVLLTEDFTKYVSSVITDNIITLDVSFPDSELPKVGEILFYGDISEKFPYGFLGKVTGIKKDDKGYIVETSSDIGLDEAFDKLYIDQECTLQFANDEVATRSGLEDYLPNTFPLKNKALPYWDDEGFSGFQYLNNLNLVPGVEFGLEGKKGPWAYGIKGKSDGEFIQSSQSYFAIKLRPIISLDTSIDEFHIHLIFEVKMGEKMKSSSKGKFDASLFVQYECPLKAIKLTPQGALLNVVMNPYLAIGIFYKLRSIESEYENIEDNYEKRYIASFEYSKGMEPIWSIIENEDFGNEEDYVESENSSLIIDKGSGTWGFSLALGLNLFKGLFNAEATADFGYERAMDYDLYLNKDEFGKLSYEKMKEEIVSRNIYVNSDFSINKLTGIYSAGVHLTIPLLNIPLKDKFLVPDFKNLIYDNQENEIEAMYSVSRELQWPVDVSLGLIRDSEKIKESETKEYKDESSTPIYAFKHTFTELSPFEDYIVQPIIYSKWGEIYATPIIEKRGICIVTKEYEYNPNDKTVTCYGQVQNLADWTYLSEYGICYKLKTADNENIVQSMRSLIDCDIYNIILTNLSPGIYEYRAYIKVGEEYYYADETKTFEVEPEEEEKITTGEATNITQTAVTLSGNIQGYEADDFQHRYGIIYSTDTTPTASNGTVVYSNNIQEDGNYSVDIASLTQNTTYYYRAFVIDGGNYVYGDVKSFITLNEMSERDILIAFYKATDGDNWRNNTNWCSDYPLGSWYGVETDAKGKVIELHLQNSNANEKFGLKGYANLSGMKHLESIKLAGNELTSLDVSGCVALKILDCYYNQLTNLNVSDCFVLERLSCISNMLSSLNISDCTSLKQLFCGYNQLTSLNLIGFTRLEQLDCSTNSLSLLEFSNCTSLRGLVCADNQLSSLDVSNCTALNTLQCFRNKLTSLDVSNCTVLTFLECELNQLTSLDVSGLTKLEYLRCDSNELITLDISDCTFLKSLRCSGNQLTSLDLLDHAVLEELYCSHNKLVALDISNCTSLAFLSCTYNQLTSLNASDCVSLGNIYCSDNQLVSLNLSGCNALFKLDCSNNRLSSLDLSSCTSLIDLNCKTNQLTSLDMSDFSKLEYLYCYNNQLVSLDVSGCTSLKSLICSKNKIVSIIPNWFSQFSFSYDQRYRYKKVYENGQEFIKYEDNGVGWWYPGEPDRGYHKK